MTVKQHLPYFTSKVTVRDRVKKLNHLALDDEIEKIRLLAREALVTKTTSKTDWLKLKGISFEGLGGVRQDVSYIQGQLKCIKYDISLFPIKEIIGLQVGHVFKNSQRRAVLAFLTQLSEMGDTLKECQENMKEHGLLLSVVEMIKP